MSLSTLISPSDALRHIDERNWVILDCRHDLANANAGKSAFAEGHIPNAQFVHLDHDLSGSKFDMYGAFRGRHPLPDKTTFIAKLRSWGINDDTQVIIYDAQGGMFAARCWWMLRWIGHTSVAVLDGGLSSWTGSLTKEEFIPQPGSVAERKSLVHAVNAIDVLMNIQSQQMTVVDARAPDRFRGENETLDNVGGHIPGAKNRFFRDNLKDDGCFKSANDLHKELSAIVEHPEKAVMQCGSGVTACHNLLSMEIAGMTGAALYPGSWSEWCSDPSRPVA